MIFILAKRSALLVLWFGFLNWYLWSNNFEHITITIDWRWLPRPLFNGPSLKPSFQVTKKSFVHLYITFKGVIVIGTAHQGTELMEHGPDRFIKLMPQLMLKFKGTEALFCTGQQMHCNVPVLKWKFAGLHYSPTAQGSPELTLLTLKLLFVAQPVMVCVATLFADHTLFHP
jgi:hypothetical protein